MSVNSNAAMRSAVDLWVGRIKGAATEAVEKILETGELIVQAEEQLMASHGEEAVRHFRKQSGFTASTYSKFKSIGQRADLFRKSAKNLPPSMSSIYLLSQIGSDDRLTQVVSKPLRECRRSEIARLTGKQAPTMSDWSDILSIRVHAVVDPKVTQTVMAEISEAIKRITDSHHLSDKINAYRRPA